MNKNSKIALLLISLTLLIHFPLLVKNPLAFAVDGIPDPPSIESCDIFGNKVDNFTLSDAVYLNGSNLEPGGLYYVYIVVDYPNWTISETHISDLDVVEGPIIIDVDPSGNIENQPVLIWQLLTEGYYDIFADSQTDGLTGYYDEYDAIDNMDVDDAGLFVIPEKILATIPFLFAYSLVLLLKQRKSNGTVKKNGKLQSY